MPIPEPPPGPAPAYENAPTVLLVDGEVVVVGPGPVAFSMTRAAARELCRRLNEALEAEASESPQG